MPSREVMHDGTERQLSEFRGPPMQLGRGSICFRSSFAALQAAVVALFVGMYSSQLRASGPDSP